MFYIHFPSLIPTFGSTKGSARINRGVRERNVSLPEVRGFNGYEIENFSLSKTGKLNRSKILPIHYRLQLRLLLLKHRHRVNGEGMGMDLKWWLLKRINQFIFGIH